jgi:hypothetical protein
VHDENRYLAEMSRLGLDVPTYVIDENAPELDELPLGESSGDDQE